MVADSCAFALLAMGTVRKAIEKREVEIIRRLKRVVKMPVLTIARAVGRNKKTVYACLKRDRERETKLKAMLASILPCTKQLQANTRVWRTPTNAL